MISVEFVLFAFKNSVFKRIPKYIKIEILRYLNDLYFDHSLNEMEGIEFLDNYSLKVDGFFHRCILVKKFKK